MIQLTMTDNVERLRYAITEERNKKQHTQKRTIYFIIINCGRKYCHRADNSSTAKIYTANSVGPLRLAFTKPLARVAI